MKAEFEVKVGKNYVVVCAHAKGVNSYGVTGLKLELFDEDGAELKSLDQSTMEMIRERAAEELYDSQYSL